MGGGSINTRILSYLDFIRVRIPRILISYLDTRTDTFYVSHVSEPNIIDTKIQENTVQIHADTIRIQRILKYT